MKSKLHRKVGNQEESVGIIGKSGEFLRKFRENWEILREFWGSSGKTGEFRGNSGEIGGKIRGKIGGKLVYCVSSMVKQNSQTVKSISPTSGEKGENERKLFHKNSPQGYSCETGGGNEREMKGNFVFTTSFNYTVL